MGNCTEGAKGGVGQAGELDGEVYAGAVGIGGSGDITTDVGSGAVGQEGGVSDASEVIVDDIGIAQLAGDAGHRLRGTGGILWDLGRS